jgi:hypothetical protein
MRCSLETFYSKLRAVDTFYVKYQPEITSTNITDGNIINLKGVESVVPGLLYKTVDSLLYLKDKLDGYDFIARTNISTVVNFPAIADILDAENNYHFFGARVSRLMWLDPPSGIKDFSNFGVPFVTGSCMFFSKPLMAKILEMRHYIDFTVIDDVALGILVQNKFPEVVALSFPDNKVFGYKPEHEQRLNFQDSNEVRSMLALRFKSNDRANDAEDLERAALVFSNMGTCY